MTIITSELKVDTIDLSYNLAAIRHLLLEAFGPDTLWRFCQDRPLFRPILADFGPGHSLNDMVDGVINYCQSQALFDQLLAAVQQSHPGQYPRFEGHLHDPGYVPPAPIRHHAAYPEGLKIQVPETGMARLLGRKERTVTLTPTQQPNTSSRGSCRKHWAI